MTQVTLPLWSTTCSHGARVLEALAPRVCIGSLTGVRPAADARSSPRQQATVHEVEAFAAD